MMGARSCTLCTPAPCSWVDINPDPAWQSNCVALGSRHGEWCTGGSCGGGSAQAPALLATTGPAVLCLGASAHHLVPDCGGFPVASLAPAEVL